MPRCWFRPWNWPPVHGAAFDHADGIHLWTVLGTTAPCKALVVMGNSILQANGQAPLGIYLSEHPGAAGAPGNNGTGGFLAPRILRNRIALDQLEAIRIDHGIGAVVQDNTLTPWTPGFAKAAEVILAFGSTGCNVTANTLARVGFGEGMTPAQIATNVIAPNTVGTVPVGTAREPGLA